MSTIDAFTTQGVRVAVEGCGHGTLNAIYAAVDRACRERKWDGVDLLIIGGDFQATRNAADLSVMSVPAKYRDMGDFHEYYSGARKAPYLTVFAGGNHEAAAYLWELYYGGWVAPNMYYVGAANVLRLGPLRIAAMSGIWKGFDYCKPHHERLPFSADDIKSFYHVREIDVRRLLQLRSQVDVGISHDWPRGIEKHGNQRRLFQMKPDFERESLDGSLGNKAAEYVMDRLRPPYWFSAHMHCKFAAIKTYDPPGAAHMGTCAMGTVTEPSPAPVANVTSAVNPDEINLHLDLDDDGDGDETEPSERKETKTDELQEGVVRKDGNDVDTELLRAQLPAAFAKPQTRQRTIPGQPVPLGITNTTVRFLALDKCLPGRKFLQLCDIEPFALRSTSAHPPTSSWPRYRLQYDPEWLAITRVFANDIAIGDRAARTPPDLGEAHYAPLITAEETWVQDNIVLRGKLDIPENFAITAPSHVPGDPESVNSQPDEYTNPQTEAFCSLLDIPNPWVADEEERLRRKEQGPPPSVFNNRGNHRSGGHRGGRGGWGEKGGPRARGRTIGGGRRPWT